MLNDGIRELKWCYPDLRGDERSSFGSGRSVHRAPNGIIGIANTYLSRSHATNPRLSWKRSLVLMNSILHVTAGRG